MSISEFEAELQDYYKRQRNRQLNRTLEETAGMMQEILLLCVVYEVLTDDPITPDPETQSAVDDVRNLSEANAYDELEDKLPALQETLRSENERISGKIQQRRFQLVDRLDGLDELNSRLEKVDPDRISELKKKLQTIENISYEQDVDYKKQEQDLREYVEEDVIEEISDIEDILMEEFLGTSIEDLVRSLIKGETLKLTTVSDDELGLLLESELGPYIDLELSGSP